MSTNTIPRDYVVTIRLQQLRLAPSATDPIERMAVTAYDVHEAMFQGLVMLDARIGGLEDHELKPVVLSIEPNCAKAAEAALAFLQDVSLAIMEPKGHA